MRSPLIICSIVPTIDRRQWLILGSLLIIGQSLIGCSASKTAQCKRLILITQNMAEESSRYRNSTDEADILKIADSFDQTAAKVEKLSLNDPQLMDYQQQLVAIYQGNGEATRSMIAALKSKDILTAKLAQDQVQKIGKQEQQVITDINRYCQSP